MAQVRHQFLLLRCSPEVQPLTHICPCCAVTQGPGSFCLALPTFPAIVLMAHTVSTIRVPLAEERASATVLRPCLKWFPHPCPASIETRGLHDPLSHEAGKEMGSVTHLGSERTWMDRE